jgi:hypothetical protein
MRLHVQEPAAPLVIYRATRAGDRNDPALARGFRSSAARGKPPRPNSHEETTPFIYHGISAYSTLEEAVAHARVRRAIGKPIGDYVAELTLTPGNEFAYAFWGEAGHLTVTGDPVKLSESVTDIVSIDAPSGNAD